MMAFNIIARTNAYSFRLKPWMRSYLPLIKQTQVKGYTKETGRSSYERGEKARSTAEEFLRQAEEKPHRVVGQGVEESWEALNEVAKEEATEKLATGKLQEEKADDAVEKIAETGNEKEVEKN